MATDATDPWDLVRQRKYQESLEGFARQLEQSPRIMPHMIVHNNRAKAYLGLRDYTAAAADYEACIHMNPNSDEGYIGYGVCQWCLRQPDEAMEWWRHGLGTTYTDAAGGVTIPGLLLYGGLRLHDVVVQKEARQLLRKCARRKQLANWPGAIVPYLLGSLPTDQFRNAAALPTASTPLSERRRCQANFYIGVRALVETENAEFQQGMRACAASLNGFLEHEYYLATWEVDQGFPESISIRPG